MDDNRIFDLFQKLADKLQENTDALKAMLTNHETRLTVLETKRDDGLKSKLLELLAKGLIIALLSIGSLVGAGGIISKMFSV